MGTITLKEARKRLGDLVDAAEHGETVVITRRGVKVVRICPVDNATPRGLPDLTAFRASIKMKGPSLTDELFAHRRDERK